MAWEFIAALGVQAALCGVKKLGAGEVGELLVDTLSPVVGNQAYDLFKARVDRTSPFLNHDLQRALRRAYLLALQTTGVECQRTAGGIKLVDSRPAWLDALNRALSAELKEIAKPEYTAPQSRMTRNLETVLQPDVEGAEELAQDLENALLKEVRAELTVSKPDTPHLSIFAQRFFAEKQKRDLDSGHIPPEFLSLLKEGWQCQGEVRGAADPSGIRGNNGRIQWIDLITSYFAHELKTNERVYRIFTSQILSKVAARTAAPQSGGEEFRILIRNLAADAERQLDAIQVELEKLVELGQSNSAKLDESSSLLMGIQTMLEAGRTTADDRHDTVVSLLKAIQTKLEGDGRASEPRLTSEETAAISDAWLSWLRRELHYLPSPVTVRGRRVDLPLDQVYVSLRGYPGSTADIAQAPELQGGDDRHSEPTVWQDRDLRPRFAGAWAESIDFGEGFRREKTLVILGDPGCGKTTLVRWLSLALARTCLEGKSEVLVAQRMIDSSAPHPDQPVSLGAARIPILLRVADIAEEYQRRNGRAVLAELLGYGVSLGHPVYEGNSPRKGERVEPEKLTIFLNSVLREGRGVLILDGLDEVANPEDRKDIVRLIHECIDIYVQGDSSNQVVVTSRIIGYELHPLRESVARYTVERLSERAIRAFSDSWHQACRPVLVSTEADPAKSSSAAFLDQIFHPSRIALRELATNPFMLSLLCVLNQEHGQALPNSRARLYELLVDRGLRSLFLQRQHSHSKLDAVIRRVLMTVAHRMHSTTSNGLLPRRELKDVIWTLIQGDAQARGLVESATEAFRMVVEGVGLLAERGVDQFGFRHQTVQEYLTGLLLVQDPATAAENLLARSADSRWREVVVLGLGALGESVSGEVFEGACRQLLAAEVGILPTGALLIGASVREHVALPGPIVRDMVARLLKAYAESPALQKQQVFTSSVERLLADLLVNPSYPESWREGTEQACHAAALSHHADGVAAFARLVHQIKLPLSAFAEPLLSALHLDSEERGWIIHRALEMIAMNDGSESSFSTHVNDELIAKVSPKTRQTLRDRTLIQSIRYAATDAQPAGTVARRGMPAYLLPMRQALEQREEWLERVQQDLFWIKAISVLYGGLGNLDTQTMQRRVSDARALLGSATVDDHIEGRIAGYLDAELQPAYERIKGVACVLQPKWFSRETPLTPLLLRWLESGEPEETRRRTLEQLWENPRSMTVSNLADLFRQTAAGSRLGSDDAQVLLLADVLLLWMACGDLKRHPALSKANSTIHEQALARFHKQIVRLAGEQSDQLLRAKGSIEHYLSRSVTEGSTSPAEQKAPAKQVEDPEPKDEEFNPGEDLDVAMDQLPAIWKNLVNPTDPRSTHRLAIFLDCHGRQLEKVPLPLFFSWLVLAQIGQSCWRNPRETTVECVRLSVNAMDENSSFMASAVFLVLEGLPDSFEFLKAFALSRVALLKEEHPDFIPCALAAALTLRRAACRQMAFRTLYGEDAPSEEAVRQRCLDLCANIANENASLRFECLRSLTRSTDRLQPEWRASLLKAACNVRQSAARAIALFEVWNSVHCYPEAVETRAHLMKALDEADNAGLREYVMRQLDPSANQASAAPSEFCVRAWNTAAAVIARRNAMQPVPQDGSFIACSDALRVTLLTQHLRGFLTNDSDDRLYSISVVLDTQGKQLAAYPQLLLQAMANNVTLAHGKQWDREGLLPSFDATDESRTLRALLFLVAQPEDSIVIAGWGLFHLIPYISVYERQYIPLAGLVANRLNGGNRDVAMMQLGWPNEWRRMQPEELAAAIEREANLLADPLARFHTLRLIRKSNASRTSAAVLLQAATEILEPALRQLALRDFVFEFGREFCAANDSNLLKQAIIDGAGEDKDILLLIVQVIAPARHASQSGADSVWVVSRSASPVEKETIGPDSELIDGIEALKEIQATNAANLSGLATLVTTLRTQALEQVSQSAWTDPWMGLNDPTAEEATIAKLVESAIGGALVFDERAAQAIERRYRQGGSFDRLEYLLPLLSGPLGAAAPLLEEWVRTSRDTILGAWAGVMLAEHGRWNRAVVDAIVSMQRHSNDVLRNRAAMALITPGAGANKARVSSLGTDVALALAELLAYPEMLPAALRTQLLWSFESIVFDVPGLVADTADQYIQQADETIATLLSQVKVCTLASARQMVEVLQPGIPNRLMRMIAHSLIMQWHGGLNWENRVPNHMASIRAALWSVLDDVDTENAPLVADCLARYSGLDDAQRIAARVIANADSRERYLRILAVHASYHPAEAEEVRKDPRLYATLIAALHGMDEACAIAAGEYFLRSGFSLNEMRGSIRNDSRLIQACIATMDGYFVDSSYDRQLRTLAWSIRELSAAQISATGFSGEDLFSVALKHADRLLDQGRWGQPNEIASERLMNVLPLCAAVAESMPDLYRRIARDVLSKDFSGKLEKAVSRGRAFTTREAAIVLLCHLRSFSKPLARALHHITSDVYAVQHAAIEQIERLREIDEDAIPELANLLRAPSANIVYMGVRIVENILGNEHLPAASCQKVRGLALQALSESVASIDPGRVICLLERGDSRWSSQVRYLGPLRDFVERSILKLSSVFMAPEGVEHQALADAARIRFTVKTQDGAARTFDLTVGPKTAGDPVQHQRTWLQKAFDLQIPTDLADAITEVGTVARAESVSAAALVDAIQRSSI